MSVIGHVFLWIALPAAILSAVFSVTGATTGSRKIMNFGRYGILMLGGLYTLALAAILYAFLTRDFSLKIVAEHASLDLPAVYTLSALYADKGGSLFFWGWLISVSTVILILRPSNFPPPVRYYAAAILVGLQLFLLCLVTLVSDIFQAQSPPLTDGYGLNPLLQNFGMLVHPPLLYLGFASCAVVFALTIAVLITGYRGPAWSRGVRRWTLLAWGTLGAGNLLGMWWSYNELGWGGYWAWDPVENAGLMPWLLITAFLHTISIYRQRNCLHSWGIYLIIFTFALTLLSPFITHGGIESPLHGFYGSAFPPFLLAAIILSLAGSLVLVYRRRRELTSEANPIKPISREGAFLLTDILLVLLTVIVLVGTVLPSVIESLSGIKLALDRSFFDRACGPVLLLLVFLMGICPLLGWSRSGSTPWRWGIIYPCLGAILVSIILLMTGAGGWYAIAALVCGYPLLIILFEWYREIHHRRHARRENYLRAFLSLFAGNRPRYGGFLVHVGIILITLGIIASTFYADERIATLNTGETVTVGNYEFRYQDLIIKQDNVKVSAVADVAVSRAGKPIANLQPSYDYWFRQQSSFAEVAVRTTPAEDLFVSLTWTAYDPQDTSATFRILVNPLILWIWVGGGFLILGGILAFSLKTDANYNKDS